MEQTEYSIIDEMEQHSPVNYASRWQRFANSMIDGIICYIGIIVIVFLLAALGGLLGVDIVGFYEQNDLSSTLLTSLCNLVIVIGVYFLMEAAMGGKSIGKAITGTIAVKEDGSPITTKDALIRSLCRQIPFEAFSIFSSNGLWHDRLTKTKVIRVR